jgi:hypothetical protein
MRLRSTFSCANCREETTHELHCVITKPVRMARELIEVLR